LQRFAKVLAEHQQIVRFEFSTGQMAQNPVQALRIGDPNARGVGDDRSELMIVLGVAFGMSPDTLAQSIRDYRRDRGLPADRSLRGRIEREVRQQEALDRPACSISEILEQSVADGLVLPGGWRHDGDAAIVRIDGALTTRGPSRIEGIPFIDGLFLDTTDHTHRVSLKWWCNGKFRALEVPRSFVLTTRSVESLSNLGLPVTSRNIDLCVEYFADFLRDNEFRLPTIRKVPSMGWHHDGDRRVFMYGADVLSESAATQNVSIQLDQREEAIQRIGASFRTEGDPAECHRLLGEFCQFPVVRFLAAGALCSLLLKPLEISGFWIDISGETSSGKSSALRCVGSLFGQTASSDPRSIIDPWTLTPSFIERKAAIHSSLPLFLDDTRQAYEHDVAAIVYGLANGRGKGRANRTSIDCSASWNLIVLSTGEQPLVSFAEKGGMHARTLTIDVPPFGPGTPENKNRVDDLVRRSQSHFGHVGKHVANCLVAQQDQWLAWRQRFKEVEYQWTRSPVVGGNAAGRLSSYLAAIQVTGEFVSGLVGIPELQDPISGVAAMLRLKFEEVDRARQALNSVIDFWEANPGRFEVPSLSQRTPSYGCRLSCGSLALKVQTFPQLMAELGFNGKEIRASWRSRGWVQLDAQGNAIKVPCDGCRPRMLVIPPAVLGAAG